jgi:hypothetical protein
MVVTPCLKRRQGSCEVRQESLERLNFAEAELFPDSQGSMWVVANARRPRSAGVEERIVHER